VYFNPLTLELNPSAQRCLPGFLLEILVFKGLTARRLYKSFGVKGLIEQKNRKIKADLFEMLCQCSQEYFD
jgi:hypothetical protein